MIEDMTEMKRFYTDVLLALLVGATAAPALAAEVTESELMQAATELGRQYDANYNGKNAPGMAALYATDGVLLSPSGAMVRGRDALKTYYTERFASGARAHAIKVVEVHVQGDGGYGIAQFSVDAPQANGGLHEVSGRIVTIYQHDPDGWHIRLVDPTVAPEPAGK
jgi:ketosteroid isomerase-like protein